MDNEKSSLASTLLSFLFLLIVPAVLSFIIYFLYSVHGKYSDEINYYYGQGFGYCLGALFHLSCYMMGVLTRPFLVVVGRIKEFFQNLVVSWKFAFRCYFDNLKTNGITFWMYLLITALTTYYGIDGMMHLIELHLYR